MGTQGEQRLSVWLVPEAEVAVPIQAILDDLARSHGGPAFRAHVTAYAGTFEGHEALQDALDVLALETPPLDLAFAGVDVGATFTQCLFARFEFDGRLAAITERVRPLALAPADYVLDPHLSLFYGDPLQAPSMVGRVSFPHATVRFDRLAVNRSTGRSTDAGAVEAWERVHEVRLSPGPVQ